MNEPILERLHFRELALRFLDSYNPQPDRAVVIADAICAFDGMLTDAIPMRHHAHRFVAEAYRIIEQEREGSDAPFSAWLIWWNRQFGITA